MQITSTLPPTHTHTQTKGVVLSSHDCSKAFLPLLFFFVLWLVVSCRVYFFSTSVDVSETLCFVFVAFSGYIYLYYFIYAR